MRDFKKLIIWRAGSDLTKKVYQITRQFPEDEKFGLTSQMRRASISIPSNIAEGCSRNSDVEYKRFLEIVIGSSFELETQLIIAHEIGYFELHEISDLQEEIINLQKQISSLINRLKGR
jgi:four helix bundle protein